MRLHPRPEPKLPKPRTAPTPPVFGLFLLVLSLGLAACRSPAPTPPPTLQPVRGGGDAVAPDGWPEVAAAFQRAHADLDLSFEPISETLAVEDLLAGRLDFALTAGPTAPSLVPDLSFIPIARDPLALITHPANTPSVLSLAQSADLYSGYLQDWSSFGLDPLPVLLVAREPGSSARTLFDRSVLAGQPLARSALLLPDDDAVRSFVASHPGAVGYVSAASVDDTVRVLPVEDLLPGQEGYPLDRTLYLVLPAQPSPVALAVHDWLLSAAGQKALDARLSPSLP